MYKSLYFVYYELTFYNLNNLIYTNYDFGGGDMYRIVFLDIDGTILTLDGQLDSELIKTISELQQRRVLIGIATGRSFLGAKLHGDKMGCSLYVTYQGGFVLDRDGMIYDRRIPWEVASRLCSKTLEAGGTFVHFSGNSSRSNLPFNQQGHLLPHATICDISGTRLDAHRLALFLEYDQRRKLEKEISEAVFFDEEDRLEIFPLGSKWQESSL
jgi:hydroxymethylpyrimidine pyrophosphatase-like HAD family hydrolase